MTTTTTKKELGPRQKSKLKKEIDDQYGKYMGGIQVNIMNLGKVSDTVFKAVTEENLTIEQGYEKAKKLYREN